MTYKIAVSAGHYPAKQGATRNEVSEFMIAKEWVRGIVSDMQAHADLLPQEPREFEVLVITTGTLPEKVKEINSLNCDLAIEIHFNAAGSPDIRGCETLYYPGSVKGKEAAEIFQREIVRRLRVKDRGVKEGWYKMDRPGVIDFRGDEDGDEQPDYFLRATNCTALILEPDFIDQTLVLQSAGRESGVKAIVSACINYCSECLNDGNGIEG